MADPVHRPVLLLEAVECLVTTPDGIYVDGTVGAGGHSLAIAQRLGPKGRLICIDRDEKAVEIARERFSSLDKDITVLKGNFADLDEILPGLGAGKVQGILLDLGLSSYQIESSGRGFSFSREEPLDMRMDPAGKTTAFELVNRLPVEELKKILKIYGEERMAGRIAKAVEQERTSEPIRSSLQLAQLIWSVTPPSRRYGRRHPATRAFQALRIAVNNELDNLRVLLDKAPALLARGGRLVVIAYHSLEDRLVKRAMAHWENPCICPPDLPSCVCGERPLFKRLDKKGIKPAAQEIEENPRARSAILRAAERI